VRNGTAGGPLRIAQVTPVYPPHRGGTGRVAQEYTSGLRKRRHVVDVFTPRYGRDMPADDTVTRLASPVRLGNAAVLPSLCWRLGAYDIVHLHYPFFGGAEPVLLRKMLNPGQALVVSYVMDAIAGGVRGAIFDAHRRVVLPYMLRHADRVLVSSIDYARSSALKGWAADAGRVEVHSFAVDADRFQPGTEPALRARFGIDETTPVLLFVSALDPAHHFKGLPVLFGALAGLRDAPWRLVVVGNGPWRTRYTEMAQDAGVGDRVVFAGDVSDADLPMFYRLADLHVFPSTGAAEAFGLVCLEAAASGIPTVASALPGVRMVILDGETGIHVAPDDAAALRAAIRLLLEDPAFRRRLGAAARRRACQDFDWDTRVARLEDTYFDVLCGAARNGSPSNARTVSPEI
jgi:glycosyltransferase involved in cell wall biosynthesis